MYNSQEIANRIKKITKSQGKSLGEVLSSCGLGINTVSKISKGTDILTLNFAKIADYLNCSVDYLLGRSLSPEVNMPVSATIKEPVNIVENTQTPEIKPKKDASQPVTAAIKAPKEEKNIIQVPLSYLKVAAGTGYDLVDDYDYMECETLDIDADIFPSVDLAIRIQGDSMEPKYLDGDIVLVKFQPTVENNEIGIFVINGKSYIKKLHIDEKGIRTLVSLNKKYKPITFNSDDDVRVTGRVICTL